MARLALLGSVGLALLAGAGCGSDHRARGSTQASGAACTSVATPRVREPAPYLARPALRLNPRRAYSVRLTTNCGVIDIRLDVPRDPRTVASFAYLVRRGFYDGLTFHRIVAGFVIQGGDPQGTGRGGPGYTIIERPPRGVRYTRGEVAMAKTQLDPPGASGSQFFIVTATDAGLPADYAVVGQVVGGADTVARIAAVPVTSASDQPLSPVVIQRATLSVR